MPQDDPKPPLSHENLVLNELIREYLEYNHYKVRLPVVFAGIQGVAAGYLVGQQNASGLRARRV